MLIYLLVKFSISLWNLQIFLKNQNNIYNKYNIRKKLKCIDSFLRLILCLPPTNSQQVSSNHFPHAQQMHLILMLLCFKLKCIIKY